ncbi:iron transporter [Halalkalicoccus sp. NIPERK01]|uniref:iron transporter n=1 Tax=Halalkalicoccus sp. NIPERK01 TaxID=3053469 RepID=UPI00256F61B9|nr:iron transporter [Halalkalicoccus sp. NIPERK01]MDL5361635.1 iron transporter [Halalkalicoccus sp. NIPERK01]
MDRRGVLRAGALLGAAGLAGCLGVFETRSAWRDPPIVEDRPDAPYIPASTEEMGTYGVGEAGEYTVALLYTFPHRFWTVTGTETNMVDIGDDDALHLMASVWETESETVVPADVRMTVEGRGERPYAGQLWPMLSQRMGFHYGDNLAVANEGAYTATLRINPADVRGVGGLEGSFEEARTVEIGFEYDTDDVYDLEFELVEESRRGQRGELPLMDHAEMGHGGGDGHGDHARMPHPTVPPTDEFPGEVIGTGESGGAEFVVALDDRFGGPTLVASPRTPQNRVVLPLMALSATIDRDGETVFEGALESRLDADLGVHYGAAVDPMEPGDTVRVETESPPQVARHDGYETAFFEMASIELEY